MTPPPPQSWPLIREYVARFKLKAVGTDEQTTLTATVDSAAEAEIVVPHAVLEWFVTVRDAAGMERISDWMEHYATAGEDRSRLESEMRDDVCDFLRNVIESPTRIGLRHGRSVLEAQLDGAWRQILPF